MNLRHEAQKELVQVVMNRKWIRKIFLYGSRARGDHRKGSDIDLAIVGNVPNVSAWLDLCDTLENLTLLPMDIVNIDEAGESLRNSIEKEGVVLYEAR